MKITETANEKSIKNDDDTIICQITPQQKTFNLAEVTKLLINFEKRLKGLEP